MNRITEGVGKKIVDALKQQSDVEIQNVIENPVEENNNSFQTEYSDVVVNTEDYTDPQPYTNIISNYTPEKETFEVEDFDMPTNVAVLKQLISQLPAGVSKQTGAQIIKQTMEALGISMKAVLQEAQQVQENLNHSSKECQASIMEYRKQIGLLERQSQKFQRQYASLNDIISLFVQTNL